MVKFNKNLTLNHEIEKQKQKNKNNKEPIKKKVISLLQKPCAFVTRNLTNTNGIAEGILLSVYCSEF
jgi:hypothetical protein